jgi:hypothetical protein
MESPYWALSGSLLRTASFAIDGAAVTDYEPLYPLFLAGARMVTGDRVLLVQVIQLSVASLGAVFLYRLSLLLTGQGRAAMLAGVLFAIHPLLVRQAAAASDLALATTLLVAFGYAFVSMRGFAGAAMAGACIGLAVLTRSMTLPVLAGGAAVLIGSRRTTLVLPFVVAALLLIVPFVARNYLVSGTWWSTRNGMNLYIGNSPYTAALVPEKDLDLLQEVAVELVRRERPDLQEDDPSHSAEVDAFLGRRALDYMVERPLRTLGEKIMNVGYLMSPSLVPLHVATPDTRVVIAADGATTVEHSATRPLSEVVAYAVATTVMLLTAAAGIYQRRRLLRHDAILWVIAGTVIVVNAMYVPASRYAALMVFVLMFYSGVALARARST